MIKASIFYVTLGLSMFCNHSGAVTIYVAPNGNDTQKGDAQNAPVLTLGKALELTRQSQDKKNTILLENGSYHLDKPIILNKQDNNLTIKAKKPQQAIIKGSQILKLDWQPYKDGIMQAKVALDSKPDVLFVNGKRQRMARYPNATDSTKKWEGYAADCDSQHNVAKWANPKGAYVHALHKALWGGMHFEVTGKTSDNRLQWTGGWQNNRPMGYHADYRFIENIFEELDAETEWFYDQTNGTLYLKPASQVDLKTATIELATLANLITVEGPDAKNIILDGIAFEQTRRTFMDNKEPLLLSDWTIDRSGALLFNKATNCLVQNCNFEELGGNAVMVTGYNDKITIKSCLFQEIGGNGICFVGERSAYKGPHDYTQHRKRSIDQMDMTPGPLNNDYPQNCRVEDCLITRTGLIEKQTSPVQIALSKNITVKSCSLYDVPRAGINIGDGCWGGHVIENCDIFDTVKETSDHGSFNSWGRDRFWELPGLNMNDLSKWETNKNIPLLDAMTPTIIQNSRWQCEHGWDIDLDDGSSNYIIRGNLLIGSGLKLREGFYRKVYNNIIVNNSLHPHVWYNKSEDEVTNNIFFVDKYFPAGHMPNTPWGKTMDKNFVHREGMKGIEPATGLQKMSQRDQNSKMGDALFLNAQKGDFRLKKNSPALKMGFKPITNQFGVTSERLKKLAKTPQMPRIITTNQSDDSTPEIELDHIGAVCRDVKGLGDQSAYGLIDETGVIVLSVLPNMLFATTDGKPQDVIIAIDNKKIQNIEELNKAMGQNPKTITVRRNQKDIVLPFKRLK